MSKSTKNDKTEEMLNLALTSGMFTNRQMVISMERALKRSLIALSQRQGNEDLVEDIKAILDWTEDVLTQEINRRGPTAAKSAVIVGPEH
jgi:hypothetical protein